MHPNYTKDSSINASWWVNLGKTQEKLSKIFFRFYRRLCYFCVGGGFLIPVSDWLVSHHISFKKKLGRRSIILKLSCFGLHIGVGFWEPKGDNIGDTVVFICFITFVGDRIKFEVVENSTRAGADLGQNRPEIRIDVIFILLSLIMTAKDNFNFRFKLKILKKAYNNME